MRMSVSVAAPKVLAFALSLTVALAFGALAFGALAFGALAFGALAFGCGSSSSSGGSATPSCAHDLAGTVTLAIDTEPILTSRAVAVFADATIGPATAKCAQHVAGPCNVTECEQLPPVDPAPGACVSSTRDTAAGPIGVKGGSKPEITMTSDAKRSYPSVSSPGSRWVSGDTIALHAAGGEVAGFDASIVFPGRVVVTTPPEYVAKTDPIEIDWKAGFTVTWTPAEGTAWIHILQGDPGLRRRAEIDCRVPSAAGTLTVSSDALQYLEGTTKATANATIDVAGLSQLELVAGAYKVKVLAVIREEPRNLRVKLDGVPPR